MHEIQFAIYYYTQGESEKTGIFDVQISCIHHLIAPMLPEYINL